MDGMSPIEAPALETKRLLLRPVDFGDAAAIQAAASVWAISDTMISIPHPYPEDEAAKFIAERREAAEKGSGIAFTMIKKQPEKTFAGVAEIRSIDREHSQAEVSFWIAVDAWGNGYMSEAVRAILDFAFDGLKINRIYAHHMVRNPACGRVLEKNGFTQE
jgi:RimJ/RimL family protein N-acetyltransferase